jgi:tRNA (guanine-N7-)-methyltransferase
MRTKFKAWTEPYINEHPEVCLTKEQFISLECPINLEIGSGKGNFLMNMAKMFPDQLFVGIERNVTCAGITCKKLVDNEMTNAKLMWVDAGLLLPEVKDDVIDRVFLNFSDPWPKKRHAKRRLTAVQFLNSYYRVLKKGGRIIIKTDQKDLYDFTLENLPETKFNIIYQSENYQELDPFDTMTEYEESFRKEGLPIYRLILEK